ncbi:MAG: peptidylprolyl isomerase [Clostridiales bacterium]|jgi:hypothetical protein|nr:peptidylprolyl isomerase [Clostridiales bacterium]
MCKKLLTIIIALALVLGLLSGCGKGTTGESSPEPSVAATPNHDNDAPASTEYIETMGDEKLYDTDFIIFFRQELSKLNPEDMDIPENATEEEEKGAILDYMRKTDENGISLLDTTIGNALQNLRLFEVSYIKGKEAGITASADDDINTFDQNIDYYVTDDNTRDDVSNMYMSMNVNDYKRYLLEDSIVTAYKTSETGNIEPTNDDLLNYYNEHESEYKTINVLSILFPITDADGNQLSDAEKAEKKALADKICADIKEIGHADEYAKGFDSSTYQQNSCMYQVTSDSNLTKNFKDWALAQTVPGENIDVIETPYGYHIMTCQSIDTYDSSDTVKANVKTAYQDDIFTNNMTDILNSGDYKIAGSNADLLKQLTNDLLDKLFAG